MTTHCVKINIKLVILNSTLLKIMIMMTIFKYSLIIIRIICWIIHFLIKKTPKGGKKVSNVTICDVKLNIKFVTFNWTLLKKVNHYNPKKISHNLLNNANNNNNHCVCVWETFVVLTLELMSENSLSCPCASLLIAICRSGVQSAAW